MSEWPKKYIGHIQNVLPLVIAANDGATDDEHVLTKTNRFFIGPSILYEINKK